MSTQIDYACDYPKTSCMCSQCCDCLSDYFVNWEKNKKCVPSSLGVSNCYVDERFNCANKMLYDQSKQPTPPTCDIKILNPNFGITPAPAYLPVNQSGFYPVRCKPENGCECVVPCKGGCDYERDNCDKGCKYVSMDPRLMDARRPTGRLKLDRPPYQGDVLLNEIYSSKLDGYGGCYENYEDIHSGQIMYYISQDTGGPYDYPNYPTSSYVDHLLFKDPMGAIKPQYERYPLKAYSHYNNNPNTTQWAEDSQFFRQDILSRQMRKMNEQSYSARWKCYN